MKSAREVAVDILCDVDKGALSNASLNIHLKNLNLSSSDKDFVKILVSGTLEHINEIDNVINANSKKKSSGLKPVVRNVLRISIFQLYYLKNIPKSAVCNEAVKIIDRRKIYGLKAFVNAFLRNISTAVPNEVSNNSEIPEFIYKILKEKAGKDIDKVKKAIDAPTKISCRFNLSKASKDEIINSLNIDGVMLLKSNIVNNGYYIEGFDNVSSLKAFNDGLIQIQGISSIKAVEILNPTKKSSVLDICAAPGGKTIAIADMIGPNGLVVSRDLTNKKAQLILQNVKRCKFDNIKIEIKDATMFYPGDKEVYDFVLADLPCSGLGTIGHKIEIRNRITMDKVLELSKLQKDILKNAVKYVKKGGRLLYSTCTITKEENEDNAAFIESLGLKKVPGCEKLLLPGIDDVTDGFFYSLFEK